MSNFTQKLFRSQQPSEAEWSEHLLEAHRRAPGMTSDAYAAYRTSEGQTSYEVLLSDLPEVKRDGAVLDLACGDGHLFRYLLPRLASGSRVVGLDFSKDELALARQQVGDPRASFTEASAHAMPFENAEFDAVFCHMAIMLMLPVEPVIAEIARVLKPGGHFAAVIGDGASASGFYLELLRLGIRFRHHRYPVMTETPTGDPRTRSDEGLRELFNSSLGFTENIKTRTFYLRIETDPEGVWRFSRNRYFNALLPEKERDELRAEMISFSTSYAGPEGKIRFDYPMKYVSVKKRD